jgi:hypothetical protein
MHAPPPFQITVCRFGAWRAACAGLATVAWLVVVAWTMDAVKAHPTLLLLSLLVLVGASLGLLRQAWHLAPASLRWDGQLWHVGPAATMGEEPQAGRLAVAVDLGAWMLLRFGAEGARGGAWLPVQRRGHELAWHGLRATVYCARPVSHPTAAPF